MEIVVVLIVVKFGVFWVITRDHGSFEERHQVEILPTDLPELFKHARDLLEPTNDQNHQNPQGGSGGSGGLWGFPDVLGVS